jgi:hypothetical protein
VTKQHCQVDCHAIGKTQVGEGHRLEVEAAVVDAEDFGVREDATMEDHVYHIDVACRLNGWKKAFIKLNCSLDPS